MPQLRRHPPVAVVVMHGDRLPHVTGTHSDSDDDLAGFAALQSLIARAYHPASRLGRFQALLRTPPATSAP